MNPSKVWQVVASGILTRLFILWLLTQIMQDRNRHREERSAMKRGPEENYDDFSSEGKFEVKSVQLCSVDCLEKSLLMKILGTKVIIHKICE